MTLSFSTTWPERMGAKAGQKNHFIQKIWTGLIPNDLTGKEYQEKVLQQYDCMRKYEEKFGQSIDILDLKPKLHTIRTGNRWKTGDKIHPVINNRTADRFQFAPTMVCTGVQDIEIKNADHLSITHPRMSIIINHNIGGQIYLKGYSVFIDGIVCKEVVVRSMALNDGFDTVENFFAYFNKDFKGQLVHWTDLRY